MELLGIEPLEEHARRLAALLTAATPHRFYLSTRRHLSGLNRDLRALPRCVLGPQRGRPQGEQPSAAAEWLLDNFPVISASARDVRHDLPAAFYHRLPQMQTDEFAGQARVYAMASELIALSAGRLDAQRLQRFMVAFQSITPLTMGELWAWPSMLKMSLVHHLSDRAAVLADDRAHRRAADRLASAAEAARVWPAEIAPAFVVRLLQRSRETEPEAGQLRRAWTRC
jgi:cyclic beta-1,2-glucan synthetase